MFLGLDFGTSKIAAVICDRRGRPLVARLRAHRAERSVPLGRHEQNPIRVLAAARGLVRSLPAALRRQVRAVGIAAQMHGVMLIDQRGRPITQFVTWQDLRAMERPGWLDELRRRSGRPLQPGYGAVTLAGWASEMRTTPRAACAVNIGDFAVSTLCGIPRPPVSTSIAHSWGLMDSISTAWDQRAVAHLDIPMEWLPSIVPNGAMAGTLNRAAAQRWGLPDGIPVSATVGDQQAAALATLEDPDTEIVITIGTGAQAAIVLAASENVPMEGPTWELRPFFDGRWLLTAASLNGGAAWRWFAMAVRRWCVAASGHAPPEFELLRRLNRLGARSRSEVHVCAQWFGERGDAHARGAILDLGAEPPALGALARGVARAIARNLRARLPSEALQRRRRVVASGNALRRNPLLRAMIQAEFGLPLRLPNSIEETATGAAQSACDLLGQPSKPFKDRRTAKLR